MCYLVKKKKKETLTLRLYHLMLKGIGCSGKSNEREEIVVC
jgi:hypothetical protein